MTEEIAKEVKPLDEQIRELEGRVAAERESLRISEAALSAIRGSLAGGPAIQNPLRRIASYETGKTATAQS